MTGTVIDLTDVSDPVFSSKAVGDGLGIEPANDGAIVSPVDATVTMVAGTGHAIGFKSESGLEILLHLGVDTVELEGAPFDLSVKVGDTVKAGQSLGTMDLEAVRAAGKATAAIVVLTNTITHHEGARSRRACRHRGPDQHDHSPGPPERHHGEHGRGHRHRHRHAQGRGR